MSCIEKLSILGIRSFGTEDKHKQVIQFNPPLTLILGQNGSGKTTIIECLRYIITGDMPPNCSRGGSFVHDPKLAHATNVKGQIKLRLKDVTKKTYYISRSLEATQTIKDIKFRTLENTISSKDALGVHIQLSSKCADIDREVCSLLGVSKAILNNVIFCHQEESNWPLSEGKALKQKFDDIFAATRYIKALDNIKKERLSLHNKVKTYEVELKYLTEKKERAAQNKIDLENLQIKLLSSKNRMKEIEEQLQPIKKNLDAIFGTEDKVSKLKQQIAKQEAVEGEVQKKKNELTQTIQTLFRGSREELRRHISDFHSELGKKKSRFDKLRKEMLSAEKDCKSLKVRKLQLTEQLGGMNAEQQNHLKRISRRDASLTKFCSELHVAIPVSKESLSERDISDVISQIKCRIQNEEERLKNAKSRYQILEQELQNHLDKLKEDKAKISHSCTLNSEKMKENKNKILLITEELSRVEALANKQTDLEENIKKIKNELEKEDISDMCEAFKKKLSDARTEKDNIEALLNQLNAELSKLQKEHKIRAEMDLLMKDKTRKEAEINKIKTAHSGIILHLLGKVPEKNVHQHLTKYISHISQDIESTNDDIEKKKMKVSSLKTTMQHLSENLRKKTLELEANKNKVFRVCGNNDFDTSFSKLEKKIKEVQDEKGALIGSQYIFTTYMEKLRNVSPCCPLCHRGFAEGKEAKDLISELEHKMKMVPSQLKSKEKDINEFQEKLNNMTELRPIREGIRKLEKDIPELNKELGDCHHEIDKYQKEIEELNEMLQSNKSDHSNACSIQQQAVIWDQNYAEVKRLEEKLSNLTCHLGSADMSRNMQIVCDEQDEANEQLDSVKAKIEQCQRKLEEHANHIQCLKSKKNDLESERLQIASNLQQQSSRRSEMEKLSTENIDLEISVKKAEEKLTEFEDQIDNLLTEKVTLQREKEEELDILQKKIAKIEKQLQDIMCITKEINRYITDEKEKKLQHHIEKLNETNKELAALEEKMQQLNVQMNELNKELSARQLKERDLQDNLKLFDCKSQLEEIKKTISNLQEHLQKFGVASLLSEKQELLKKRDDLTSCRHQALGEQMERERAAQHLQHEIEHGTLKDADLKHHYKLIEIRTTEIAAQDLNKYYIALDCAIMRYHSMKMNEINKIIRELWIKTYQGSDIDYIEIRSDAQEGNLGLEKKRVYNYKVVMLKGDIAIDMRGRCSAGQKVLASLIIRLALAETFCLNCGILALDEPTTNLDRDNIESLAGALAEIVQSRSHQSNFQLIVITHDQDFIELLGRSDAVDYFYSVSRDRSGVSKITKSMVQSLQ